MEFGLTSGKFLESAFTDVYNATSKVALLSTTYCNHSQFEVILTIHAVKNGSVIGDKNRIVKDIKIGPKDSLFFKSDEKFMLNVGDKISAISSIPGVVSVISTIMGMPVSDFLLFGLGEGVLLNSTDTSIFTATEKVALLGMHFCNNSDNQWQVISVRAVKSGDTAGTINEIITEYLLPPLETLSWKGDEKFMLGIGDKISAISSNSGIVSVVPILMGMPIGG